VRVEIKTQNNRAQIIVTDNGRGITPEVQEKIFDPFYTTRGPQEGTGLGLYLTYKLVRAHKGTIHVESKQGEGTTMTIELPLAK
jgi:signal transduction histidine kinase